jgi:hypothetical protein
MATEGRIAVLADVHGNAPALRAVLAEVDDMEVDAIVVAGDVVGGPQPREALELLAARPEPVRWIAGNAEHEALAVLAGRAVGDDPPGRAARWSAAALDAGWEAAIASWPIRDTLGGVLFRAAASSGSESLEATDAEGLAAGHAALLAALQAIEPRLRAAAGDEAPSLVAGGARREPSPEHRAVVETYYRNLSEAGSR